MKPRVAVRSFLWRPPAFARWGSMTKTLRCRLSEEQKLIGEAFGTGADAPCDRVSQDGELVTPEARGNQDDAAVRLLSVDQPTLRRAIAFNRHLHHVASEAFRNDGVEGAVGSGDRPAQAGGG